MHNRNIIMNKEINFTLLNMVHVHIEHVMVIGNKNTLTADWLTVADIDIWKIYTVMSYSNISFGNDIH